MTNSTMTVFDSFSNSSMWTGGSHEDPLPYYHQSRNLEADQGLVGLFFGAFAATLLCFACLACRACARKGDPYDEDPEERYWRERREQREQRRQGERSRQEFIQRNDALLQARTHRTVPRNGDIEAPPPARTTPTATPTPPRSTDPSGDQTLSTLELSELMELYQMAFEESKRQTVLEASQIMEPPSLVSEEPEESIELPPFNWASIEDIDDESMEFARESVRSARNLAAPSPRLSESSTPRRRRSSLLVPVVEEEEEPKSRRIMGGSCMICLEEMEPGETVVWSETEACPHVYHKDCLVSFLAHNCKQQARLPPSKRKNDVNPCPACRQQFVTVLTAMPATKTNNNNSTSSPDNSFVYEHEILSF